MPGELDPISSLTAIVTPTLADLLPTVNAGVTKKITWEQFINALLGTMAQQNFDGVFITGGSIDGADIGLGSPGIGRFIALDIHQQSGFTNGDARRLVGGVQTSDATPTPIFSIVVNQGEAITVTGNITGAKDDHTEAVGGTFQITARRAIGGDITLVGSVVTNVQSSSTATFSAAVDTGAQALAVFVTGVVANTYNWTTNYVAQRVVSNL